MNLSSGKPSLDDWLQEAQLDKNAGNCGMYLFHTGVVRETPKKTVRNPEYEPATAGTSSIPAKQAVSPCQTPETASSAAICAMQFSHEPARVKAAIEKARQLPGIYYLRVWLNEGLLSVGDPLMLVLIGGDIRPRVIAALESLVEELKTVCVTETELK